MKELIDFFIPYNNENTFLDVDNSTYNEPIFLYSLKDFELKNKENKELKMRSGIIIKDKYSFKDIEKAKKLSEIVVVKSGEDLRSVIEKSTKIFIYGTEFSPRQDFIHQRDSGLNHVLLDIAIKNKIKFIFSIHDYMLLDNVNKAKVLGRLKQNIEMLKKFNAKPIIASFAENKYEIKKDRELLIKLLESNRVY